MQTSIPIGIYHPSIKLPDHIDLSTFSFFVSTYSSNGNFFPEKYPGRPLSIRTYLYNGKDPISLYQHRFGKVKEKAKTKELKGSEQFVLNELFSIDGNPRRHLSYSQIMSSISEIYNIAPRSEIIINEMNPYHIPKYTGNGFQKNGVIPFILEAQKTFPKAKISLGIQTIGNVLCKDILLQSLNIVLNHIKTNYPALPIHFTEVGYYHDPYAPQQQIKFLDAIREIAIENDVSSLCYIYPWDGDYFHLAGQPRNSICGIWDEDWNVKYHFS